MALEIEKTFTIKAPADAVWAFLTDVNRVARCMPGAAITGQLDDKTYTGTMSVKVGPVASSYKGKVIFEKLDPAARTAEIAATGQDVKGKGGADMRLSSALKALAPGETEVVTVSKVNITGVLAQMGRGMIQDVSDQMFGIFSERMRAELEGAAVAAAPAAESPPPASAAEAGDGAAAGTASGAVGGSLSDAPTAPISAGPSPVAAAAAVAAPPPPALPPAPAPALAAPTPAAAAAPEVLDLGAIGAKVARNTALRLLSSPAFWLVALAIGLVLYLLVK